MGSYRAREELWGDKEVVIGPRIGLWDGLRDYRALWGDKRGVGAAP